MLGPRRARSLDHSTQYQRGIDSAEAEGISKYVLDTLLPPRTRQKIKIARLVRNLKVDGGRQPLLLERERADGRLDRSGRAESVSVITLGPAHGDFIRAIAHHFLDRHRFRAVVERRRAAVRVDVADLVR